MIKVIPPDQYATIEIQKKIFQLAGDARAR
jgi:hypothetical protein